MENLEQIKKFVNGNIFVINHMEGDEIEEERGKRYQLMSNRLIVYNERGDNNFIYANLESISSSGFEYSISIFGNFFCKEVLWKKVLFIK